MSASRIASRYSKSLLDLAIERNELSQVLTDINYVRESVKVRDLYLMIKSPIVNPAKKQTIFQRLFAGKISKMTESFFKIMIRKGRESILPEILDSFIEQYKEYKNISTIVIKTAAPMPDAVIANLRKKLEASHAAKENLEIEVKVDSSLIGGFILEFEGKQYDASMATKLHELRKQFS
jgi:F-type H+-transporting ATPase subunit delta